MNNRSILLTALIAMSACASAQQNQPTTNNATTKPQQPLSFFVTSTGVGKGADLGGLTGADQHCQQLATAVGSKKTWHAYLSTQAADGKPAINARDRIGTGPW